MTEGQELTDRIEEIVKLLIRFNHAGNVASKYEQFAKAIDSLYQSRPSLEPLTDEELIDDLDFDIRNALKEAEMRQGCSDQQPFVIALRNDILKSLKYHKYTKAQLAKAYKPREGMREKVWQLVRNARYEPVGEDDEKRFMNNITNSILALMGEK